ncbi:MAG: MFS transporter [Candidatus Hermodarchaeota archaeon]
MSCITEQRVEIKEQFELKTAVKFGTGQFADIITYQTFFFWIFTFYYTIVIKNSILIGIAFIIWSVWNAFNDPLLGYLSDRTHTRWGRRIPWMITAIIPLSLVMFLLFTPPITFGITSTTINFIYFFIIIIIFEFFYTMFSLNQTSLFPEQFIDGVVRGKVNSIRQMYTVVGLVVASILPSFFFTGDPMTEESLPNWSIFSIVLAMLTFIFGFFFIKWAAREKVEFKEDYKEAPSFFKAIKLCVKSKSFRWYIPAEICNWFVYGILPTVTPLYGRYVLGIEAESFELSILLGIIFISAAIFVNLWRWVAKKIGSRKAWMSSLAVWIITLIPFLFISSFVEGLFAFFIMGIGLAGSFVLIDLIVSDIIDEDEVNTGIRREAAYYGVNALFMRFSTVFVFLAVGFVFAGFGWEEYEPLINDPAALAMALKILMAILPVIAIIIAILSLYKYPLYGEKLKKVREKLKEIHEQKKSKI